MFNLPLHVEAHGREPGDGDTFVLLHGYGASSFSWRTWSPALERRGHVVNIDLKGFGSAPKPDDGRYAPTDQAELVHRLIRQRDLRDITLIGHSLGGGVALLTALHLLDDGDDRLRRLVIVSGAAYLQRMPPFVGLARHARTSSALLRILGARRVIRWVLRTIVHDKEGVTRSQVEGYADPLRGADARRALITAALQIVPPDLDRYTARYREIDVPTLVLWGKNDRVVPPEIGRRLAADLPRARLVELEACGHIPAEELPRESLEALEAFLDAGSP